MQDFSHFDANTTLVDGDLLAVTQTAGTDVEGTVNKCTLTDLAAYIKGEAPAAAEVGTAGIGVTAAETGSGAVHTTILTLDGATCVWPDIPGGADLGVGTLIYTFPTGIIMVESAYMEVAIQEQDSNINADTPDVGLGTVIATGVINVLGGTATFEDIVTGLAATDCDGDDTAQTRAALPTAGIPLMIAAADAHTVHLNGADGWAASGEDAALLSGTVVLNWRKIS